MVIEVTATEDVRKFLDRQPESMKKIVLEKIRLLAENPRHPSLNVHLLHHVKGHIRDCYITDKMRLLFDYMSGVLRLWDLGGHDIVDKAHLHTFVAGTHFEQMEVQTQPSAPVIVETTKQKLFPPRSQPELPLSSVSRQQGTPNHFRFFQDAHLRILGVPAYLLQPIKDAPSLEDALALAGLPEQTCLWLSELSTSPHLQEVMFDPSRLLYRTTFDLLEGYCEGKIKRLMLNLQRPEQQQFVDMERVPLLLLKGAAGSGKTTVGIYRAIRLAEQGRRVLMVTYNKTLASVTKSLIEELIGPLPKEIHVTTLHSFYDVATGQAFVYVQYG